MSDNQWLELRDKIHTLELSLAELRGQNSATSSTASDARAEVTTLRGQVSGLQRAAFQIKCAAGLIAASIAGVIGYTIYAGEVHIKAIAREVAQEELTRFRTYSQTGSWSDETRVPGDAVSFRWELKKPVDPLLAAASAIPQQSVPGIVTTATITPDGKFCVMTLDGDKPALDALQLPVAASMTVTVREPINEPSPKK